MAFFVHKPLVNYTLSTPLKKMLINFMAFSLEKSDFFQHINIYRFLANNRDLVKKCFAINNIIINKRYRFFDKF